MRLSAWFVLVLVLTLAGLPAELLPADEPAVWRSGWTSMGKPAETIDCADVLAFELREALTALGSVTGEVTTDDLLGEIFSKFCIGK